MKEKKKKKKKKTKISKIVPFWCIVCIQLEEL